MSYLCKFTHYLPEWSDLQRPTELHIQHIQCGQRASDVTRSRTLTCSEDTVRVSGLYNNALQQFRLRIQRSFETTFSFQLSEDLAKLDSSDLGDVQVLQLCVE